MSFEEEKTFNLFTIYSDYRLRAFPRALRGKSCRGIFYVTFATESIKADRNLIKIKAGVITQT